MVDELLIMLFNLFDNEIKKKREKNMTQIKRKTHIKIYFDTKKKSNYDTSVIDFINVFCLDDNVNLLFRSVSDDVVIGLLINDNDVR
jgi:hypothetical protein